MDIHFPLIGCLRFLMFLGAAFNNPNCDSPYGFPTIDALLPGEFLMGSSPQKSSLSDRWITLPEYRIGDVVDTGLSASQSQSDSLPTPLPIMDAKNLVSSSRASLTEQVHDLCKYFSNHVAQKDTVRMSKVALREWYTTQVHSKASRRVYDIINVLIGMDLLHNLKTKCEFALTALGRVLLKMRTVKQSARVWPQQQVLLPPTAHTREATLSRLARAKWKAICRSAKGIIQIKTLESVGMDECKRAQRKCDSIKRRNYDILMVMCGLGLVQRIKQPGVKPFVQLTPFGKMYVEWVRKCSSLVVMSK